MQYLHFRQQKDSSFVSPFNYWIWNNKAEVEQILVNLSKNPTELSNFLPKESLKSYQEYKLRAKV